MKKFTLLYFLVFFVVLSCQESSKKPFAEMTEQEQFQVAQDLAKKYIILDGHVDLPFRMVTRGFMMRKEVENVAMETTGDFDYPKAKKGGLDAPFMSVYVPSSYQNRGGARDFADSLITMVKQVAETYPDMFAMAYSPKDIERNFNNGLISLPMGMENGAPIEEDISRVKYYAEAGIRYITLTHATDNKICDSSYDTTRTWNGLSPFGEQVIAEMNKWGIMVDISHVSDSAAMQTLRITKAPVIASHSSCRKFTPGWERNMSDEIILALAENKGVIHINFGSDFLSKEIQEKRDKMDEHLTNWAVEKGLTRRDTAYQAYAREYATAVDAYADVQTVADHIDHVVALVGIDHVGLGSDYDGVGDSLPKGLKDVSSYPNLILELLKRGYTEEDIAKICYKNTFRVWNKVIEVSQALQRN